MDDGSLTALHASSRYSVSVQKDEYRRVRPDARSASQVRQLHLLLAPRETLVIRHIILLYVYGLMAVVYCVTCAPVFLVQPAVTSHGVPGSVALYVVEHQLPAYENDSRVVILCLFCWL